MSLISPRNWLKIRCKWLQRSQMVRTGCGSSRKFLFIVLAGILTGLLPRLPSATAFLDHRPDPHLLPAPGSCDSRENPPETSPDSNVFVNLIDENLGDHWKFYCADETVPLAAVWKLVRTEDKAESVLVCTGQPKGFLSTTSTFTNFELTLDWKFPTDANGNSGILIYTQDEPRIWPTSMQIQFHQPKAGSVFPSGDARSDNTTDVDLARPVNTWNECRVVSRSGRITVEINGTMAGETTGAEPSSGKIALQSEGSEVHFRNIRVRKLPEFDPDRSKTVQN